MEESIEEPHDLIKRFRAFGPKDRQAVLEHMSQEERLTLASVLSSLHKEERLQAERQKRVDRQFLGYSSWLADLIEQSQTQVPNPITATCAQALWDTHSAKFSDGMMITRKGWLGLIDRANDWLSKAGRSET